MTTQNSVSTANLILLSVAGLCLLIALAIAWILGITLFFPDGALAARLVERNDVIRAHVDYLMMAQFLLIFFLGFRQYAIDPPYWLIAAGCFGAFFNPLAFLIRGLTPTRRNTKLQALLTPEMPVILKISVGREEILSC